jgi:hypothetical protein
MKNLKTAITAIIINSSPIHPIRTFCDEYAIRPQTPKPLLIRTAKYLGNLQGSSNRRFEAETTRLLDEKYRLHVKAYTDGSNKGKKVGYAVVLPEKTIKKENYHKIQYTRNNRL